MIRRVTLQDLPPTAEVELLAHIVAAERFAAILEVEDPPVPSTRDLVCAIVRAHRRCSDAASRN